MDQQELLAELKSNVTQIDQVMRDDLSIIDSPQLSKILNHAIFNGGKRVRPLLAILAADLCASQKKQNRDQLYKLAITLEYLHAASLLHDDVIDNATQRRGQPSANKVWGSTSVILAGDYLHTRAMTIAGTEGGPKCLAVIGRATAAMVEAEFLQMKTVDQRNTSTDNYFAVLNGKTAALIKAACEIGVLFAGGNKNKLKKLSTYGANLGLAFQIIDDLLDYLGDPAQTGKAVGNDLSEGKLTLPLIHTLEQIDGPDHARLLKLLAGEAELQTKHFEQVRALIAHHQGFDYARRQAEQLIDSAVSQLDTFPDSRPKEIMTGLAQYVLERKK
ncbi:MAG: polyprenyl synthetase family protein [Proteobacteria bacterium]|nr:polyprenyl synthetase family protein [Pseudomonadota bacterium]MBU1713991.1 polyprenyl synthetase family protein [Pseudomonadota bacterium]